MTTERRAHGGRPEARPRQLLSTPARAGLLLGASAAVYAVTLAGVTGWQAETTTAAAVTRAAQFDAVTKARAANDDLEDTVRDLEGTARGLVAEYAGAADEAAAYRARLEDLSALVADVQGTAAAIPARISLPAVAIHGAVGGGRSSRAPATAARTGASGG